MHAEHEVPFPSPDDRAQLARMPGSSIPVIRQPFRAGDLLPYWAYTRFSGNHLYVPDEDPGEERNLAGDALERDFVDLMGDALRSIDAPDDQFVRLGL